MAMKRPNDEISSFKTMLALTLVSKIMSEVALDEIWYRLGGLEPLLSQLPEDACRVRLGRFVSAPSITSYIL